MSISEQTDVYRIIGLDGFLSMLLYKRERYVRPIDVWEDTFEGYMLHQLDTYSGRKKVLERLYELSNGDIDVTIRNISKLLRSRYACYAQCWSINRDSDAMWRIYSNNKQAIQLKTSVCNIRSMLASACPDLSPEIEMIKYDINDEKEAFNKILVPNAKISAAYFHKRPAFMHEAEIRVLLNCSKRYASVDGFAAQAIRSSLKVNDSKKTDIERVLEKVSQMMIDDDGYLLITQKMLPIEINDLRGYIDGIRVHPQAEEWYVELIKKLCKNYKLEFLGKSDLYRSTV